MTNSLSQRIAKDQKALISAVHSRNKAAFIAQLNDIIEAINDGWSNKAIWHTLSKEGKIPFSYKTFCIYIAESITHQTNNPLQENTKEGEKEKNKPQQEIRGFTFNPKPNPEELL